MLGDTNREVDARALGLLHFEKLAAGGLEQDFGRITTGGFPACGIAQVIGFVPNTGFLPPVG